MFDIIPDIHGQYEKLELCLHNLGYREKDGAFRNADPSRRVIFLGDFIDRGSRNGDVLNAVRRMVDAGTAQAIMGNHELNAIKYHRIDPATGLSLRSRKERQTAQHITFLQEFPLGSQEAKEWIDWMANLPLFLDLGAFRAVHACWDDERIQRLRERGNEHGLSEEDFIVSSYEDHELYDLVETTTKGPDEKLPKGYAFEDTDGSHRKTIRVQWWNPEGRTWRDIAMSVPDLTELPDEEAPEHVLGSAYPSDAPPVFFGHYWMTGDAQLQAHNALCLDYSAGRSGPLMSYRVESGDNRIHLDRLSVHTHS